MLSLVCLALATSSAPCFSHVPAADAPLQLVESFPVETTLDHPEIPDAADVWLEMIDGAHASLEMAEFYASDRAGSRLTPIVRALERAAARGVKLRLLFEEKFYKTYPETIDAFARLENVQVRRIRFEEGVLHAKYFVVDARDAYLGSQNLDWRSFEHIQELGVRVRLPDTVARLRSVFELDWARAGGAAPKPPSAALRALAGPERASNGELTVTAVASPGDQLPDHVEWDLPHLIELIDGARERVRVQLLTYKMTTRDKSYWEELESALRRAAARGVRVQLLLADWCKRRGTIEGLQALEPLENVDVKLVTIPAWSGGFVPYARVAHAKYLVADGADAWIGTSNWERDYFYAGRNVGLIVHGASFASQLARFFDDGWSSSYASALDACARYEAPRVDK